MSHLKASKLIFYFTLAIFTFWFAYSFFLLMDKNQNLALLYSIYLMLGILAIFMARNDIFSPLGLFTLIVYQSFGINIPLIVSGSLTFLGHIPLQTLINILAIVITSQLGFFLGYLLPIHRIFPGSFITSKRLQADNKPLTSFTFVTITTVVVLSCIFRIIFHLGEAGIQPSIPYAGYFLYIFFNGVLIICTWYFIKGIRQSHTHTILSISLLLVMAGAQAYLGWRGGIIHILLLVFFSFWYNHLFFEGKSIKIMSWAVLIILLVPTFMQQANQFRTERLGGDTEIAATPLDFFNKMVARSQGTTRLAAVSDMIGPLTIDNDFFITSLYAKGISATKYVDMKIYNIGRKQSHSVGTSGPGSPYVALGLLGVASAYFMLGILFRVAYHNLKSNGGNNPFTIVWYVFLAYALFSMITENLNLNSLKLLSAEAGMIFLFATLISYFRTQSQNKKILPEQTKKINFRFVS